MSARNWILFVLALISVAGCTQRVDIERERAALLATDQEWMQAAGDADKFSSFYAADASVYQPGAPAVKGRDGIRDNFKTLMSMPGFALKWTVANSQVGEAGDIAYLSGAYDIKIGEGGEKGKYVTVWKKQADGSWKVTDDIFNADATAASPEPAPGPHTLTAPGQVTWGEPPPVLPPGMKFAVLLGDPSKPEPFVIRADMPAGYTIAPHWHPTDEQVTVLTGSLSFGMGDTLDKAAMTDLPAGGYALMPAKMHHYAMAKTPATIQVHGMGPFAINYVNPADDPSHAQR